MTKLKSSNIGWGERLAVITEFNLDDATATAAFNVTVDELTTARDMSAEGQFTPPANIDFEAYRIELEGIKRPTTTVIEKPVTATKPAKELKKRGRKGDKIVTAFTAIPHTPVPAEVFASHYNISMAVLRQSKRFDKTGLSGDVKVKKDRELGTLMVWREGEGD